MKRMLVAGLFFGMALTTAATITSTVTYYRDVLPILQKHCQSCHRPGHVAPMSFLSYKETRPWAEAMKYVVLANRMPPWFAQRDRAPVAGHDHLKLQEVETIVKWVEQGAPAGDPKDAPPPVYVQQAWQRSQPLVPGQELESTRK
jgi:mono/diheme cytochrome c family protein